MTIFIKQIFLILILAFTSYCYWAGLYGDFVFDDSPNILNNEWFHFDKLTPSVVWKFMVSGEAGLLKRPISMASFGLNIALTGFDPFFFKLTNLVIHLINGCLIYLICKKLCIKFDSTNSVVSDSSTEWVAIAATGLWLLHPLNLTSVLYIVQRMTSLCALFSLLAIWIYLDARSRMVCGKGGGWIRLLIWLPIALILGLLSKETAALIPVYLFIIEWIIYRFKTLNSSDSRRLYYYFGVILGMPLLILCALFLFKPDVLLAGFRLRDFTLTERLLTESRVLFYYMRLFIIPENAQLALFHDDFITSRGLYSPLTTISALLALAFTVVGAFLGRRKTPLLSFAIFWFIGGHLLESTFLPLELIHEHRNYLPMVGPTVVICYYLIWPSNMRIRIFTRSFFVLIFASYSFVTYVRAEAWSSLVKLAEFEVMNHPYSERANIQMGRIDATIFAENKDERLFNAAEEHYRTAMKYSAVTIGSEVGILRLYSLAKRDPPEDIKQTILEKLAHSQQPPLTPVLIQTIVDCNISGSCVWPDDFVLNVLFAFLDNPDVYATDKLGVRMLLAQYLIDKMSDGYRSLYVLEQLRHDAPDFANGRRNLARMYRLTGQLDMAQIEVDAARKYDKWGSMEAALDGEQEKINGAKKAALEGNI